MKNPELVVGHLKSDQLFVKSVTASKYYDWHKWLEPEELVAFFEELLRLVTQISEEKKTLQHFQLFLLIGEKQP